MTRRYVRRRPRRKRPADEILLRFLMEKGGSATRDQICHRTADGKLFTRAVPLLGDLVAVENTRGHRSHRPITRVSLTLRGWAAAQALQPDWTPTRLATPILRAWLDELAEERDPWATGILCDADDAREWRAVQAKVEKGELVIAPPKPKARPRGRPYIQQGIHGPSTRELPPTPRPKAQRPSNHARFGGGFHSPLQAVPQSRPMPVAPTPEPKRDTAAEARKAELKRHCVICADGGVQIEHDCARFQVA